MYPSRSPTILHQAARFVFAFQLLSTLAMFGVIWFVQIAHYPMFLAIDAASFVRYEAAYTYRMGFVAGPLMIVELGTSLALLFPALRPAVVGGGEAWAGLALVGALWASTALLQVPLHTQLQAGFDAGAIARLVRSNWLRTAAWTARAGLVLVWVDRLLRLSR